MSTKEEAFFGVKHTIESPASIMNTEEDIDVDVVDDTPEEDKPYVKSDSDNNVTKVESSDDGDEIKNVGKNVKDRINKLKWEYHEERRAKEMAQRLSDEAVSATKQLHMENQRLLELVKRSQGALNVQAKGRADAAVAMAEDMLRRANELGDPDAVSTAQKHLIEAKMIQSNYGNVSSAVINDWKAAVAQQDAEIRQAYQQHQHEVESDYVQQPDPKALSWQEDNPWFGSDYEMTSFAYGVHDKLVSQGIDPDTDEYYQLINSRVREVFPSYFDDNSVSTNHVVDIAPRQRANPVVAPAKRGSASGGSPRKIVLTQTQVRLAKRLGLSPQQYAAQLLKEKS